MYSLISTIPAIVRFIYHIITWLNNTAYADLDFFNSDTTMILKSSLLIDAQWTSRTGKLLQQELDVMPHLNTTVSQIDFIQRSSSSVIPVNVPWLEKVYSFLCGMSRLKLQYFVFSFIMYNFSLSQIDKIKSCYVWHYTSLFLCNWINLTALYH